jgi:hypothetical protein
MGLQDFRDPGDTIDENCDEIDEVDDVGNVSGTDLGPFGAFDCTFNCAGATSGVQIDIIYD